MDVCRVHVCGGTRVRPKEGVRPLELHMAMICLMCVLKQELGASGRATSALALWTTSPASVGCLKPHFPVSCPGKASFS